MNFKSLIILIVSFTFLANGLSKSIQKKVNKAIEKTFIIEDFQLESIQISEENTKRLKAKFSKNNFFKINKEDTLIGYAYLGKAPSKTDQFDYLVLFDTDLIVVKTKVLVYREDYGGEIGSKRWLKQFIGSTKNSDFRLNDNIVAISGATISVKSMTIAMNQVMQSIGKLQELNIL